MKISYNNNFTLNLGDAKADHSVVVFANLGCPWCRRWYVNNLNQLTRSVSEHKLSAHLKFLNKPKQPLHNGNLANSFVDYSNPNEALRYVKSVYDHQAVLDQLGSDERVINFLETTFNVQNQIPKKDQNAIVKEAKINRVKSVPTIFFDGIKHADSGWNLPEM